MSRLLAWCGLLAMAFSIAAATGGCATGSSGQQSKSAPDPNAEPCAMRLHDISGALLFYYSTNYRLPNTLEDLKQLPGFNQLEFTCPDSKKPYVYSPDGIRLLDRDARIIMYDSVAAHKGYRWAITITPGEPNKPPFATVEPIPEDRFGNLPSN